jgi:hypothetical protein
LIIVTLLESLAEPLVPIEHAAIDNLQAYTQVLGQLVWSQRVPKDNVGTILALLEFAQHARLLGRRIAIRAILSVPIPVLDRR